jgi:hypothetical protein
MFCKFLSCTIATVLAANEINKFHKIPMINQFYMMRYAKKGKKVYCKMLKNVKEFDRMNFLIMHHYKCSVDKSKEYKELLSVNELDRIEKIYADLSLEKDLKFDKGLITRLMT